MRLDRQSDRHAVHVPAEAAPLPLLSGLAMRAVKAELNCVLQSIDQPRQSTCNCEWPGVHTAEQAASGRTTLSGRQRQDIHDYEVLMSR